MDIPTPTVIFLNLLIAPVTFAVLGVLVFLTAFLIIYPYYVCANLVLSSEPVGWEELIAAEVLALAGAYLIVPRTLRQFGFLSMKLLGKIILYHLCRAGTWIIRGLFWILAKAMICVLDVRVWMLERKLKRNRKKTERMMEKHQRELEKSKSRIIELLTMEKKMARNRRDRENIERDRGD